MPVPLIHLTTFIEASAARVFNLSRSIDLHRKSMQKTGEEAVDGRKKGLLEEGETVTWRARHLGKYRLLTVKMAELRFPEFFADEMVKGDFKSMRHEHFFKPVKNGTIMIDLFRFESPFGLIGRVFSRLYLKNYLKKLLEARNDMIKVYAENNAGDLLLNAVETEKEPDGDTGGR